MRQNERFLEAMSYMNTTMKADNKAGHQWTYCNVQSKKLKGGFEAKRKPGNPKAYKTNCVDGVQDALLMAGVPSSALAWYGGNGNIVWCNKNAEAEARKYFDIIPVKNKTLLQLWNDMELCDGDIPVGYVGFSHTNCYYGGSNYKKFFDSGHAYATPKSGEGARFSKWIGSMYYKNKKVKYLLRLKDRATYRVQAGAYNQLDKYAEQANYIKSKGYKVTCIEEDGMYKAQVGSFSGKSNAARFAAMVKAAGIDCFVKEIT